MPNSRKEIETDDARQGETVHRLRYMLAAGLVLALTALVVSWAVSS